MKPGNLQEQGAKSCGFDRQMRWIYAPYSVRGVFCNKGEKQYGKTFFYIRIRN